jgi:hypothetical protein
MAHHLLKKRRLWYAQLTVPKDVRDALGTMRFVKSLGTDSRTVAERRAAQHVSQWKIQIEKARAKKQGRNTDPIAEEAAYWRAALEQAKAKGDTAAFETTRDVLADLARDMEDKGDLQGALRFHGLATGKIVSTKDATKDWTCTAKVERYLLS